MNDDAPLKADEFRATLYFDGPPNLSEEALAEAWGREGYVCERDGPERVFQGFRGGCFVAGAAAFLASSDASFIAGTELFVDGGQAQI